MKTLIGMTVGSALLMAAAEAAKGGGSAVQDTQKAPVSAPGEIALADLDKSDLQKAYTAINEAYDIQWAKGGIEDTQAKLTGLQNKVGEKVYAVAKVAVAHCKGKLNIARLYFLALCKQAEVQATNRYVAEFKEEKPMGQLIPLWATYKSAIATGMESGLDLNETIEGGGAPKYATAAQYRAAVQSLRSGTGSQAGNTRGTSEQGMTTQLQVVTKDMSPKMQGALAVLMQGLRRLTHEEQDKFSDDILSLGQRVVEFADSTESEHADSESDETREDMDVGTKAALQGALDQAGKTIGPQTAEAGKGKRKGARAA